jgi:hypothetical protein
MKMEGDFLEKLKIIIVLSKFPFDLTIIYTIALFDPL